MESSTIALVVLIVILGLAIIAGGIMYDYSKTSEATTATDKTTDKTTTTTDKTTTCPECKSANAENCKSFCKECKECIAPNATSCAPFITKQTCGSFINSENCASLGVSTEWADRIISKNCGSYTDLGNKLNASQPRLTPCTQLSNNGFKLVNQLDGNVVIYDSQNKPLWAINGQVDSAKWGAVQASQFNTLAFQPSDGNLVLYSRKGEVLWATNTEGKASNGSCILTKTGALIIVDSTNKTVVWSSTGTLDNSLIPASSIMSWLFE